MKHRHTDHLSNTNTNVNNTFQTYALLVQHTEAVVRVNAHSDAGCAIDAGSDRAVGSCPIGITAASVEGRTVAIHTGRIAADLNNVERQNICDTSAFSNENEQASKQI